ncbi:superoxide reductase [Ruminiclostridium sufflavum DSM 19573]|uniref:Superoxide reductase n=1 Tax=Ruminiclostridium sufflavum DSM 19573 TaxID=1121337 RepID=A0A318XRB2_9FIRM|nr:desulfoferrodoxin family protein [Ruminiclostridium sufflavum]PYG89873.1 superoxide reductase [Ruminiclostridium sufflavum DSM 19573]
MKNKPRFFVCKHCGNLVTFIKESGAPLTCCGELMSEISPNTVDAAVEKHVPVVTSDGNKVTVKVGSVEHPMIPEHFIQWIYLETDKGYQIKYLKPEEKPEATFLLNDEKAVAAYEYCNLHGLWKKEI